LAGTPYRDGSYEYYLSEPIRKNDLKGVGPFIMASIEIEIAAENAIGQGKKVGGYHFNKEVRKNAAGQQEPFHYTWEDRQHSGYWLWGKIYRELGAPNRSIPAAPTAENLKGIDVYIIVDPDTKKESPTPNFVQAKDIAEIEKWVKAGGVLVLMAKRHSQLRNTSFQPAGKGFGIQFTNKNRNMVQGLQFEQGRIDVPANDKAIFKNASKLYIKELSPIAITPPAKSALTDHDDIIMAVSKYGKGTVFALGDPWIYNEYLDGRRINNTFQNFEAAKELSTWLLQQTAKK
jgi:unsaturated rhamnogalacturonyl hydrolase